MWTTVSGSCCCFLRWVSLYSPGQPWTHCGAQDSLELFLSLLGTKIAGMYHHPGLPSLSSQQPIILGATLSQWWTTTMVVKVLLSCSQPLANKGKHLIKINKQTNQFVISIQTRNTLMCNSSPPKFPIWLADIVLVQYKTLYQIHSLPNSTASIFLSKI